jgi:hypothetical protein
VLTVFNPTAIARWASCWLLLVSCGMAQERTWRTVSNETPVADQGQFERPTPRATRGESRPTRGEVPEGELEFDRPTYRTVAASSMSLPNDAGQVWKQYDLRTYTARITNTKRPERTVVDWVLRETGYEAWHGDPMGILSAGDGVLRVYHTPEMQQVVAEVVSRFTSAKADSQSFTMRVVTISDPNWRSRAHRLLRPVPAQTPGVQAWMLKREDAALLIAELAKRTDYREHSSPQLLIGNGETHVLSRTRPRSYIRDLLLQPNVWPGFEAQADQIEEGFAVEFSPLLSADGTMVDAVFKCHIDHVEELTPVLIDVPTAAAPRQRARVDVPQMSHFRLQERFRWPVDEVLLIGLGVVPAPFTVESNPLNPIIKQLPLDVTGPSRADMLIFVEAKDRRGTTPVSAQRGGVRTANSYHGRY